MVFATKKKKNPFSRWPIHFVLKIPKGAGQDPLARTISINQW